MTQDFETLRQNALKETKQKIKESVSLDNMIINAISNVEELEKTINTLTSRIREWYMLKNPETEDKISDNEALIKNILEESQSKNIITEMGAKLEEQDEQAIITLANAILELIIARQKILLYLEKTMEKHCKNVLTLAGTTIGAKLFREAGSLKKLASLQSSTIQLLGAEKALFRHIKTGSRTPKHGFIVNHPLVTKAQKEDKGRVSRALADKISICARLDYFKGEFLAPKILQDLEKKFEK